MAENASGPSASFRYWAFISYSQRDAAVAKRLHEFLETYRIPRDLVGRRIAGRVVPRRLSPIFRDRDELPGASDLGATIHNALSHSDSLIVVCSPNAALSAWVNEEIRSYKAMGRTDRCFPLLAADDPSQSPSQCFPPALRFHVDEQGVLTDRVVEPLAADVGVDGWRNACLKLVAGILGVGFDELRRREAQRQRRKLLARAIAGAACLITIAAGYLALADADISVPGGDVIRRHLDRQHVTVFRPVLAPSELNEKARSVREQLRRRLLADVASGVIEREKPLSAWTIGEVVAAGARDADTPAHDVPKLVQLLDLLYRAPGPEKPTGHLLRETVDDVGNPGRAEPILWSIMALSSVLARQDAVEVGTQERLRGYLDIAQRIAEEFYPLQDGGWNTGSHQLTPERHFIYTTGMALHMLLDVQGAHLGWLGSRETVEQMVRNTTVWLTRAFVAEPGSAGWRRSLDDDRPPDTGITLLVYSALGRACAQSDALIEPHIADAAIELNGALRRRSYDYADPDIRYDVRILDAAGSARNQVTVTRMIWYGWAVQGVASWRRCAAKLRRPPEAGRALDRSLSHLLSVVSPEMLRDVLRPQRPLWVNAETYYGLAHVP